MQTDTSLLKCGETATSNQVDRLGLSPLPITTGREPIAMSQFITTTESGLLKIRLVNADVHLTQMFLTIVFIISTMIFLFLLNTTKMWLMILPITVPITLLFSTMFYIYFKDENHRLANSLPIIFYSQKQQILLSYPSSNSSAPRHLS